MLTIMCTYLSVYVLYEYSTYEYTRMYAYHSRQVLYSMYEYSNAPENNAALRFPLSSDIL